MEPIPSVDFRPDVPDVEVRPVEDRPGYFVGRDGSAWKLGGDGRLVRLSVALRSNGYAGVRYSLGGDRRGMIFVANAVLRAFVGPPPVSYVARHWPDRDPMNNRVENLIWAPSGAYRLEYEARAKPRVGNRSAPSSTSRFVGPLAGLIEDDRRRTRRLCRTAMSADRYRSVQVAARARAEASKARARKWAR